MVKIGCETNPVTNMKNSEARTNLLVAMTELASNKDQPKVYRRLPDVKEFRVKIQDFDPLFEEHGIKKRFAPLLEFERYSNRPLNRYIEHQEKRLEKYRISDPERFWRVGEYIVRRSRVFYVLAFYHVFPRWHREMNWDKVLELRRRYQTIIRKGLDEIDYKRVYIEKPGGKYRPLGVPKPEWRIYLHQWAQLLSIYLYPHQPASQHGYIPGRGTLTAWKEIFLKVLDAAGIYEFDLKGFFDSVNTDSVTGRLLELKVPKRIAYHIESLNQSQLKLPETKKINEELIEKKQALQNWLMGKGPEPAYPKPFVELVQANGWGIVLEMMKEDGCESVWEWIQLQWALYDEYQPSHVEYSHKGLAQGSPMSPILCTLMLHPFFKREKMVMYADDGLTYGDFNLNEPNLENEDVGITQNKEKSGWVKRWGVWHKPLKFLGLEYDGFKDEFRSSTRKGAKLIMDKESLIQALKERDFDTKTSASGSNEQGPKWIDMITSRIFGMLQSRMYQGSWNLDEFRQDFTLKFTSGSWCARTKVKVDTVMDVFNSSSIAAKSLVNTLKRNAL